jgi:hypothetical protein
VPFISALARNMVSFGNYTSTWRGSSYSIVYTVLCASSTTSCMGLVRKWINPIIFSVANNLIYFPAIENYAWLYRQKNIIIIDIMSDVQTLSEYFAS